MGVRIVLSAALCAFLVASNAAADLAPNPVQSGDFYFGAGISLVRFQTEDFDFVRLYVDDDWDNDNRHTTTFDRDFLLSYEPERNDNVYVAEVHAGYAFRRPLFGGKLGKTRLHFKAMGYRRSGGAQLPDGVMLGRTELMLNPLSGNVEERQLQTHVQPLDGSFFLANGDEGTWFHWATLTDVAVEWEQSIGSGDMMIYFDEPAKKGPWIFTRGAGLTVGFDKTDWTYRFRAPGLDAGAPGIAPAAWHYRFDMGTFFTGPKVDFALGFEPHRIMNLFISGSLAPMLAITSTQGLLHGPCLFSCVIDGQFSVGTYGVSRLANTDVHFAWDARVEAGASIYFRVIRLSASVGMFSNNLLTAPYETLEHGFSSQLLSQWGYYGRAVATIGF